jgi:hypothetical protein
MDSKDARQLGQGNQDRQTIRSHDRSRMARLACQRCISGAHGACPVAWAIELKHPGTMNLLKPDRLCCATFFKSISVLKHRLFPIPNVGC